MHRGLNRLVRSACSKWNGADNSPSSLGNPPPSVFNGESLFSKTYWKTEDASQTNSSYKKNSGQKDAHHGESFPPNKHTWGEAFCVTSGLILTYQVTHRKQYLNGCGSDKRPVSQKVSSCPLSSLAKKVSSQPVLSVSVQNHVIATDDANTHDRRVRVLRNRKNGRQRQNSIDTTPFLKEELNEFSNIKIEDKREDYDNFVVQFSNEESIQANSKHNKENVFRLKSTTPLVTKKIDDNSDEALSFSERNLVAKTAKKLTADLFNVLGAYEFVKEEKKCHDENMILSSKDPPIHALKLLSKGMELGSSRAIYNIGVAYDRSNRVELAKEYYKKAADLGHPLGAYNSAIYALKDGKLNEGFELLKYAAENGVPEAKAAVDVVPRKN